MLISSRCELWHEETVAIIEQEPWAGDLRLLLTPQMCTAAYRTGVRAGRYVILLGIPEMAVRV